MRSVTDRIVNMTGIAEANSEYIQILKYEVRLVTKGCEHDYFSDLNMAQYRKL